MASQKTPIEWDADIGAMRLTESEKNGLQVFRNYNRAFDARRLEEALKKASAIDFDTRGFKEDLQALVDSPNELALLAACSIADDLLKEMFKRLDKPGLDVKDMVGPLGPLSDLNRRLKVAALADLIDLDDFEFFDRLRKLRNRVAHGRRVHPPTAKELAALIEATPSWLDVVAPSRGPVGKLSSDAVDAMFKAGLAIHLGKLALNTVFGPFANSMRVRVTDLIAEPNQTAIDLAGVGIELAVGYLEQRHEDT